MTCVVHTIAKHEESGFFLTHRALSDKELAERSPQVISCNEALREVTLFQSTAGKQMSRTFRFDKVGLCCGGDDRRVTRTCCSKADVMGSSKGVLIPQA